LRPIPFYPVFHFVRSPSTPYRVIVWATATVVCVITGNGLKDPEIAIKRQSAQFHQGIPATLENVATVMGFKH
jgi:threonine synthase